MSASEGFRSNRSRGVIDVSPVRAIIAVVTAWMQRLVGRIRFDRIRRRCWRLYPLASANHAGRMPFASSIRSNFVLSRNRFNFDENGRRATLTAPAPVLGTILVWASGYHRKQMETGEPKRDEPRPGYEAVQETNYREAVRYYSDVKNGIDVARDSLTKAYSEADLLNIRCMATVSGTYEALSALCTWASLHFYDNEAALKQAHGDTFADLVFKVLRELQDDKDARLRAPYAKTSSLRERLLESDKFRKLFREIVTMSVDISG